MSLLRTLLLSSSCSLSLSPQEFLLLRPSERSCLRRTAVLRRQGGQLSLSYVRGIQGDSCALIASLNHTKEKRRIALIAKETNQKKHKRLTCIFEFKLVLLSVKSQSILLEISTCKSGVRLISRCLSFSFFLKPFLLTFLLCIATKAAKRREHWEKAKHVENEEVHYRVKIAFLHSCGQHKNKVDWSDSSLEILCEKNESLN